MPLFAGESNKKNKIKPGCTFSHFQGQEDEILSFSSSQEEKKGRAKQAGPDVRSSGASINMSSLELIASEHSLQGHSHRMSLTTTNHTSSLSLCRQESWPIEVKWH